MFRIVLLASILVVWSVPCIAQGFLILEPGWGNLDVYVNDLEDADSDVGPASEECRRRVIGALLGACHEFDFRPNVVENQEPPNSGTYLLIHLSELGDKLTEGLFPDAVYSTTMKFYRDIGIPFPDLSDDAYVRGHHYMWESSGVTPGLESLTENVERNLGMLLRQINMTNEQMGRHPKFGD